MSTGKAGKHINFNWEMVKFGIYILFPVSSLYIYNSPQLHDSQVFKDQNVQIKNFRSDRDKLYKLPHDSVTIKEHLDLYKKHAVASKDGGVGL